MSTKSLATRPAIEDDLCQGDIFRNIKYSYIDKENDEYVDIIEYEFPLAVIVSQACDVTYMSQMQSESCGKPTKFMPTLLLCPIYDGHAIQENQHLADISEKTGITLDDEKFYTSKEQKITRNDMHYRFHLLEVADGRSVVIDNGLIDFKHCFSVPASYLLKCRDKRLYKLESIFAEQVTLRFAAYLSRVAIP